MKIFLTLTASLFLFVVTPFPTRGQFNHTELSPSQPTVADEVIVTLSGDVGEVRRWNNSFYRDDSLLCCDMYALLDWEFSEQDFRFTHNFGRLEVGDYTVHVRFFLAFSGDSLNYNHAEEMDTSVSFSVSEVSQTRISLVRGWNLVSSWVQPSQAGVSDVVADLREAGLLLMVKDQSGHFYVPENGFNNIPAWDARQGYQIYVSADADLQISGRGQVADIPIPLRQGWNMTAYFPERQVSALSAFRNIVDNLIIAKNGNGRFYIPAYNYNGMPALHRGAGYFVNVRQAMDLVWNQGN